MYIIITYSDDNYYRQARADLEDPEMGLADLSLSVYFTDCINQIEIFDHDDNVKKIDLHGKFYHVEFINGNELMDYADRAEVEIKTKFN